MNEHDLEELRAVLTELKALTDTQREHWGPDHRYTIALLANRAYLIVNR